MAVSENRKLIEAAFARLAMGDGRQFMDLMGDEFVWIIPGSMNWRGRYVDKSEVRARLLGPLFENFAGIFTNAAKRIIAEGEIVVVECVGNVVTKGGERYDNHYCYVIRMVNGKMVELTEYMDTALADRVLTPPPD